jgi:outer membrane protein assembly factor BamB
MKAFSMLLCLGLAAVLTCDAWAKRSEPKKVNPVIHGGVKYVAPNVNGREGKVEALDQKTGEKLWDKVIYTVKIDPNLEEDVQWVFITALSIRDGKLLVTNEKGDQYTLDFKTKNIEKVKKDGPARTTLSPTASSAREPVAGGRSER